MHTTLDCIPCLVRQTLEAARFATTDEAVHEKLLRETLRLLTKMDMQASPPEVAQYVHRALREMSGVADPYRAVKDKFNEMAMAMYPRIAAELVDAEDPLALALRYCIVGNVIDFGVNGNLDDETVNREIHSALDQPFHGDLDDFRQAVNSAKKILYLADNAGEIVFDRLLIEQLPTDRVTLAVRGKPILNDVTIEDARTVGLCEIVDVIDNGSDAPGTLLSDCSTTFRDHFFAADLIIAKGQGNFESLSGQEAPIYFLFKAKCDVIADHVGQPKGTNLFVSGGCGFQPQSPL